MNSDLKEDEEEILEAFKIFDKNGDNSISAQELSSVFRSLGYNFSNQDIENMLGEINKKLDEELNYEDFKKLLRKQEQKLKDGDDELIEAFRIFDRDGNGRITAEELKHVMQSLGETLSDQDIEEMIKVASNDKQYVTLQDFVAIYLVIINFFLKYIFQRNENLRSNLIKQILQFFFYFYMNNQKDLFGSKENQGQNYSQSRPNYPEEFYNRILSLVQNKENYLDLACGTGQVYFKLADKFSKYSLGADISQNMLEQARLNLYQYNQTETIQDFFLADCLQVGEIIQRNYGSPIKFDLITVGQALHWFDVERFFQYAKENLLRDENSVLAILSYFPVEIRLDIEYLKQNEDPNNQIFKENQDDIANSFSIYNKIFYEPIKG